MQKSSKKRGVLPFYSLNHETLCCPPVSYPPVVKLSFETVCINKSPHPTNWKSQEAEMEQSMQALEPQGDGGYGLYGRHHKPVAKVKYLFEDIRGSKHVMHIFYRVNDVN